MHAVGLTEVAGSFSTVVETLGEEAFATANWDPGMLGYDQSRLTRIECSVSDLVQQCLTIFESNGDVAAQSKNPTEAIVRYSTALSLNPSNPAGLLVKRSKARAILGLWEDALKDADEVWLYSP